MLLLLLLLSLKEKGRIEIAGINLMTGTFNLMQYMRDTVSSWIAFGNLRGTHAETPSRMSTALHGISQFGNALRVLIFKGITGSSQ